jgi:NAD(P)H-hydrate epimerase
MLRRPLSRDEVRDVDRRALEQYGLPGIVLMENAGRGAAQVLVGLGVTGCVVVCAGKGNNGGDGFVMARHLDLRGIKVRVLTFCEPGELSGDAAANYRVLKAADLAGIAPRPNPDPSWLRDELATADWIIDALVGTGTQGAIREPLATVITAINAAGKRVLAVDIPSGLDCDTGRPSGVCVRANETVTFVARKPGFNAPGAADWTGRVHVVDIGLPRKLLEEVFSSGAPRVPDSPRESQ